MKLSQVLKQRKETGTDKKSIWKRLNTFLLQKDDKVELYVDNVGKNKLPDYFAYFSINSKYLYENKISYNIINKNLNVELGSENLIDDITIESIEDIDYIRLPKYNGGSNIGFISFNDLAYYADGTHISPTEDIIDIKDNIKTGHDKIQILAPGEEIAYRAESAVNTFVFYQFKNNKKIALTLK